MVTAHAHSQLTLRRWWRLSCQHLLLFDFFITYSLCNPHATIECLWHLSGSDGNCNKLNQTQNSLSAILADAPPTVVSVLLHKMFNSTRLLKKVRFSHNVHHRVSVHIFTHGFISYRSDMLCSTQQAWTFSVLKLISVFLFAFSFYSAC